MGLGQAEGSEDGSGELRSIWCGWMERRDLVSNHPQLKIFQISGKAFLQKHFIQGIYLRKTKEVGKLTLSDSVLQGLAGKCFHNFDIDLLHVLFKIDISTLEV